MLSHANEKILFLGASRGLGASVLDIVSRERTEETLLVSRKPEAYEGKTERQVSDFSKPDGQAKCLEILKAFEPTRVFYFAGGGPFGPFQEKQWKDHLWAIEVSLLFPAKLLLECLKMPPTLAPAQLIFVGSSVAESRPDPFAASYAMAKHGLLGLASSVQAEALNLDLRLFSPHYMDTELLPKNAWPRQKQGSEFQLWNAGDVAKLFSEWAFEKTQPWHLKLEEKTVRR
jgi:short-subunit dehydrogenase